MTNHSKYIKYTVAHDSTDTRFPWLLRADGAPLAAYINMDLAIEALKSMQKAQACARDTGFYVVVISGYSEYQFAYWDRDLDVWTEVGSEFQYNDSRYSFIGAWISPATCIPEANSINTPSGTAAELVGA